MLADLMNLAAFEPARITAAVLTFVGMGNDLADAGE